MNSASKTLSSIIRYLLFTIIFLFPLVFTSFFQDPTSTTKLYFLGFGLLVLLTLSTIRLIIGKKISWSKTPFDNGIVLVAATWTLSLIISSPNKIQALLNPTTGLVAGVSLVLLYFVATQGNQKDKNISQLLPLTVLALSTLLISILELIFAFNPLQNASLPYSLGFLKNAGFTPLGSQLDVVLLIGFFVIYSIGLLIPKKSESGSPDFLTRNKIYVGIATIIFVIGLGISVYQIVKPVPLNPTQPVADQPKSFIASLPPYSISWYAAVESLKNPRSAIFGVGIDNYSALFTQVKPVSYNQTPLWQLNYTIGRSGLLHLWTTTGILGLIALVLLLFTAVRFTFHSSEKNHLSFSSILRLLGHHPTTPPTRAEKFALVYIVLILLLFPISLPILFALVILLAQVARHGPGSTISSTQMDLSGMPPILWGLVLILIGVIGTSGYFLSRGLIAEYYFKKSIDASITNNTSEVYGNMRKAIITNRFIEKYRTNFAQLNLIIANNFARKVTNEGKKKDVSKDDQQRYGQYIQQSISEGKAAIALNPQKVENWANLAFIYKNLMSSIQEADVWTISLYQRAIALDPQNPALRLNLGGVYYSLKDYKGAATLFSQAISLKPNWPNAYYNFAWASFQNKDVTTAVNAMQTTISLLDENINANDIKKAKEDLEKFKSELPKEGESATNSAGQKSQQLELPKQEGTKIEPKIKLPSNAEPPKEATSSPQKTN